MSSLYDKRRAQILTTTSPTGTAQPSSELDCANEPIVALVVLYTADGSGKTLSIYPEVRVPVEGVDEAPWVPALSASLDVSGATVDAEGLLPLPAAAPFLELAGIDTVEVPLTVHVPVPLGDRFRVRFVESPFTPGDESGLTILGAAARGAS